MDTIRRYSMLIGGAWVDTDDRFEIRSPATEEPAWPVPMPSSGPGRC
jgi:hypothetical protein